MARVTHASQETYHMHPTIIHQLAERLGPFSRDFSPASPPQSPSPDEGCLEHHPCTYVLLEANAETRTQCKGAPGGEQEVEAGRACGGR